MIKNINKIVAVAIATVFLIPVVTFAEPSVSDAGSSGSAVSSSAPSTSDSGNAGVTSSPSGVSTSDQGNSAVSSSPSGVSTSDQGNSAVSNSGNNSTPSTTDQGNSGNTSSGGSSNNSNNGDSSGSRGGGRSRRLKTATVINALPVVNTSDCPYISSYMKMGGNNDVAQVTKLQTFLKNNEKLNVDINGKFDQKTMDAVRLFQTKYASEILLPWGGSKATGHVFYTTQKKINELVCNKAIALTPVQLKAIQDFKDGRKNETVKIETNNDGAIKSDSTTTTPVIEVGVSSTTDDEQTASVVEASVGSKIWSFVKWLFGYKK